MSPAELSPAAPVSTAPAPPAIELTFADLANLGCRVVAGAPGTRLGSIDIDSRRIGPGDWFLAHRGEQADGHDFLADVKARGAAGAIIEDPTRLPSDFSLPALQVDDHAAFLERLAKLIRDRFAGQVVGITGSVGKTTCKHTLAHLLSHDRAVLATPWNWNTEIGVPLTLSRLLSHGADVLVLELAMRGRGQIRELAEMCRPTVAVLTGIAPVHLEQLGSLWAILEAKLELFEHMDPAGWWVYPAPDAFIRAGIAALPLEQHKTLRFVPGIQMVDPGDPDLLAGERFRWDPVGQRWHFTLHLREKRAETNLATVAMGQIWSALAASAGALALGLTLEQVAHRLPLTPPITGRMELQGRFPNRTILVDCYNSNPVSAGDALETLVRIGQGRPTVAVLGGMKELGPEAERYHRELGGKVRALNIGTLLAVGEEAPWIAAGAAGGLTQVFTAAAITDAEGWLGTQIPGDAVVLLKGSRTYALERALDLSW